MLVGTALVVLAAGVAWLAARRSDQWVLYVVGIVVSPALLALLQPTNLWAERYFLVSAVLWLLLAARLLAWSATRSVAGRAIALLALAPFVAGNASRSAWLVHDGRGAYAEALGDMAARTSDDAVTIESDHDFRNRLVIEYFAPRLGTSKPIRYVRQ